MCAVRTTRDGALDQRRDGLRREDRFHILGFRVDLALRQEVIFVGIHVLVRIGDIAVRTGAHNGSALASDDPRLDIPRMVRPSLMIPYP
jgi:hypothetical protein